MNIGDMVLFEESIITKVDTVGSQGVAKITNGNIISIRRKMFGEYVYIVSLDDGRIMEVNPNKI